MTFFRSLHRGALYLRKSASRAVTPFLARLWQLGSILGTRHAKFAQMLETLQSPKSGVPDFDQVSNRTHTKGDPKKQIPNNVKAIVTNTKWCEHIVTVSEALRHGQAMSPDEGQTVTLQLLFPWRSAIFGELARGSE